jgi:CheY-like chemotaxis protein
MVRTILVADPHDIRRERMSVLARLAGYRVVTARTVAEAMGALNGCPISAVVMTDNLLRRFDLRRLLMQAPVVVMSDEYRPTDDQNVFVLAPDAPQAEVLATLIDVAGEPCFTGPRYVVPSAAVRPPSVRSGPQ